MVISPLAETKFNSCSGRQIEDWSWWQSWSFLCALQFCFWDEDLKTNILGWWEFQPVTIPPLAETKLRSCSGRSQQNEPWNLLGISRLVGSVIFMYVNPWTFSKISFCQSLAETSVEQKYRPEDYETFFQASFTNNLHYRWHYMGQQWERSLFSNFQLCGGPLAETGSRAERGHWRQNDTLKHLFRAYFTQFWRKFWNRGRWFWELFHAPNS